MKKCFNFVLSSDLCIYCTNQHYNVVQNTNVIYTTKLTYEGKSYKDSRHTVFKGKTISGISQRLSSAT